MIGTPLVMTCSRSWRSSRYHSWSRWGPHFTLSSVIGVDGLRSIELAGWQVLRDWAFQLTIPAYMSEFLLKLTPLLCHWSRLFVSLQVRIPSESECLCTNLVMVCARLVVPPPQVSLRRVDHLVSGVLMAVVLVIVYRWPIDPQFFKYIQCYSLTVMVMILSMNTSIDTSMDVIYTAEVSAVAIWLADCCLSSCGSKYWCGKFRSSVSQD